jgi:hypothetical protein
MVAQSGSHYNEDLQAGNAKHCSQTKLHSTFDAITLAE